MDNENANGNPGLLIMDCNYASMPYVLWVIKSHSLCDPRENYDI